MNSPIFKAVRRWSLFHVVTAMTFAGMIALAATGALTDPFALSAVTAVWVFLAFVAVTYSDVTMAKRCVKGALHMRVSGTSDCFAPFVCGFCCTTLHSTLLQRRGTRSKLTVRTINGCAALTGIKKVAVTPLIRLCCSRCQFKLVPRSSLSVRMHGSGHPRMCCLCAGEPLPALLSGLLQPIH